MSSAAQVGAFMLVVLAILGFFILKIEDVQIGRKGPTKKVTAVFNSVAGLDKKSVVRVAGVRAGKVDDIRLREDGKAEVTLDVDPEVRLHSNARAHVAPLGLLGEKYIELDPGTQSLPLFPAGQQVVLRGSQPATIDEVTSQVSAIAQDVKAITASMRTVMTGPAGQERLEEIVDNVRQITGEVRALIAENRNNVNATMSDTRAITASLRVEIPKLASTIDRVASQLGGTVGENRQDLRGIVENMKVLSADLRTTSDNMNSITGQVRSGQGSMGKLFYSDEAHDRLTSALGSVESGVTELKNTLARVNRIGLDVGVNGDYYASVRGKGNRNPDENLGGNSRSAVWLRLTPNPERNRFYNIELADSPQGRRQDRIIEETATNPANGAANTTITHETKFTRDFVVSAQAGWNLQPFAVRIGLIDSTGGGGVDYQLNDRIRVTGEAFDFGKRVDDKPHIRAFAEYMARREKPRTPSIFVRSGIDNVLNKTSFTFGGGVRWRDDDLKYLLGSVPIPK